MVDGENKKDIVDIIKENSSDGKLSCPAAFKISSEYSIFPDLIGIAMNTNKIKITGCQLGLFGHDNNRAVKPAESVSEDLEDKIFSEIEDDNKIACAAVWQIAQEMKLSKFEVACACEKFKIKIFKCQLGAF